MVLISMVFISFIFNNLSIKKKKEKKRYNFLRVQTLAAFLSYVSIRIKISVNTDISVIGFYRYIGKISVRLIYISFLRIYKD